MAVKRSPRSKQIRPRHLWLASLGTVVLVRREARDLVNGAVGEARRLRERAGDVAADTVAIGRGALLAVRERVNPAAGQIATRVGQGLAPVLERLGRVPARAAARKSQARRTTRKPAAKKKATPRPTSARKQAERRVASKGR